MCVRAINFTLCIAMLKRCHIYIRCTSPTENLVRESSTRICHYQILHEIFFYFLSTFLQCSSWGVTYVLLKLEASLLLLLSHSIPTNLIFVSAAMDRKLNWTWLSFVSFSPGIPTDNIQGRIRPMQAHTTVTYTAFTCLCDEIFLCPAYQCTVSPASSRLV